MNILLVHLAHFPRERGRHPRHSVPPMDLAYAASLLRNAGHTVTFVDTGATARSFLDLVELVGKGSFEVVVAKPMFHLIGAASELLRLLARTDAPVIVVGPSATLVPAPFTSGVHHARAIATGEWETGIVSLVEAVTSGGSVATIPGAMGCPCDTTALGTPPLIDDLDALPMPAHDLLLEQGYRFGYPVKVQQRLKVGYILSSRGCPHRCVFCSPVERVSFGSRYRARSPESVVDEMAHLEGLGVNAIYFEDDLFFHSKERVRAICEAILARGVRVSWVAQSRVVDIEPSLASLMARAGCSTICLGIESGDDGVLSTLDKGITVAASRRTARTLSEAGIWLVVYAIIGAPGETKREMDATIELAMDLDPMLLQLHFFTSYPGSRIHGQLPLCGPDLYSNKFSSTTLLDDGVTTLMAYQRAAYRRFYLRPTYMARYLFRRRGYLLHNLPAELALVAQSVAYFFERG